MKKAKAFDEIATKSLACRSLGHAWEVVFVTRRRTDGGTWEVTLECTRCKSGRNDIVPANSSVNEAYTLSRSYDYHDNYLVDDVKSWGGAGLLKRNAREQLFRRFSKAAKK